MKQYLIHLLVLTLAMTLAAFAVRWIPVDYLAPLSVMTLPLLVLYFTVVDGVQYWLTVGSIRKSPKAFVQFFLGISVGVLFLHLIVLVAGMFSNPPLGKRFAVAFLILYVVYTVFVIAELVMFARRLQNPKE